MAPAKTIQSSGVCCIVGPTEQATRMAGLVQDELGVTCIVNDAGPIQLPSAAYDVAKGQLTGAYGALGNFKLEFAHLQPLHPAGRGELGYEAAKPTARSECDVFIDLRGGAPAFPSHEKRNGYFWADPKKTGELERIALTAREMVGEFENRVLQARRVALRALPGQQARLYPLPGCMPDGSHFLLWRPYSDRFGHLRRLWLLRRRLSHLCGDHE